MMKLNKKVAIIGGGSWATAIAKLVVSNVQHINWYIFEKEIVSHIKKHHHNPQYLSSVEFDIKQITFHDSPKTAIENSEIVIFVVPSAYIKATMDNQEIDFSNKMFVNAVKGIVPEDNLTVTQYFQKKYGLTINDIAVISGPCHAEEIALERLSYLTVAANKIADVRTIVQLIHTNYLKTVPSKDIYGIEYAAVLKNIYALGVGICHGLGYGDNFTAVFVSNSLREMKRFLKKVFEHDRNLAFSAYMGDLLVTAYSQFSRNRTFGNMIGKGYSAKSAMLEMNMVAEGYYATRSIHEINLELKVKMPIANTIYRILYEKRPANIEMKSLTSKLK